jgi:hypothetical protein
MHKKQNVIKKTRNKPTSFHKVKSNANNGNIYDNKYSAVIVFSSFTDFKLYSDLPALPGIQSTNIIALNPTNIPIKIIKILIISVARF